MVDAIVFYIDSSGYSFWSSDLNKTTRIAPYSNHFPYSVTLSTKGQNISWLPTRVPFLIPQNTKTWCPTLYYFRSLFNDHRRPISWIKELSNIEGKWKFYNPELSIRNFTTPFPQLFYKTKKNFSIRQIFIKLFFKNLTGFLYPFVHHDWHISTSVVTYSSLVNYSWLIVNSTLTALISRIKTASLGFIYRGVPPQSSPVLLRVQDSNLTCHFWLVVMSHTSLTATPTRQFFHHSVIFYDN